MNKTLSFSIPILVTVVLFGLTLLNSHLMQKKMDAHHNDYAIIKGVDFANGKDVTFKSLRKGIRVWTKYENNPNYSKIYAKYSLGHDKPLFMFAHGTMYVKNPFVYVSAFDKYEVWWHFWDWDWRFFEDIGTELDNGQPIYDKFFSFLEANNLPVEEVQQAYAEAVKLANNRHKFNRFVFDFIDSHEKQSTIDLVAYAAQYGRLPPEDADWFQMVNHILKFRDDFPDNLPDVVMDKLLSVDLPVNGDFGYNMSFSLFNYLLRPTEYNALHAALHEARRCTTEHPEENRKILGDAFDILLKHELLEKFLLQVYPDDMKIPSLPTLAPPSPNEFHHDYEHIYYTDACQNLPAREKLLKISCFPEVFKPFWQERLKKLQENQKAQ